MSPNVNLNPSRAVGDECPDRQRIEDHEFETEILNTARPALVKKMIQGALSGNVALLKLCAERLSRCSGPLGFSLPEMTCVEDLPLVTAAIIEAVMKGVIQAQVGADLGKLVTLHANALREVQLAQRLEDLECERRQ